MDFDPVLLAPRAQAMKAAGLWQGRTIGHYFAQALSACPDKSAIVAYRGESDEPRRISYRELDDLVGRIAGSLQRLGVARGDVVSWQLPNWWEFIALSLACVRIGAVSNPVMSIFRERELEFMLNFGETKVFIVPQAYRGFDYAAMARGMIADGKLPHLKQLVVVDGAGDDSFGSMLLGAGAPAAGTQPLGADDVLLLMYTSGTTGEPKGVMHTSNTLFSNLTAFTERLRLGPADITLGASPMAHLTGYGYLAMIPLMLNSTSVLQDVWEGQRAMRIMAREGVTFSMASAPFLADMLGAVSAGVPVVESFRTFCCAGAPIPPHLIVRAWDEMKLTVCSAWGMTENGAVTLTEPDLAREKSGSTDGRPLAGMQVKIADADGRELPLGETGRLLARGCSQFGGYLKRPHLNNTDAEGWFDTGDMAFMDAQGYIRINGRSKDIIIRGGENIPVMEVENLIFTHPAVEAVAVVAYPDERLGERACAYVVPKAGQSLTLADLSAHLSERKVAVQYHPERLEVVTELPRTPSGKVQKFKLRDAIRQSVTAGKA